MTKPNRVSAGVPTGGEFARSHHAPADITLEDTDPAEVPAEIAPQPEADRPFRDYSPTQVDKEIVRVSSKIGRAESQIARMQTFMSQANDFRKRGRLSEEELQRRLAPLQLEVDKFSSDAKLAYVELEPYAAEFQARGGWPRGWYVPGGHIHRSESCSSLRPTTQIGLVVELSGQTEDEIVEAAGETACTVC